MHGSSNLIRTLRTCVSVCVCAWHKRRPLHSSVIIKTLYLVVVPMKKPFLIIVRHCWNNKLFWNKLLLNLNSSKSLYFYTSAKVFAAIILLSLLKADGASAADNGHCSFLLDFKNLLCPFLFSIFKVVVLGEFFGFNDTQAVNTR